VFIDSAKEIFVADAYNNRVQRFSRNRAPLVIGSAGNDDGELKVADAVAVGPSGRLFVADFENSRIEIFDTTGAWLGLFGGKGSAPGKFDRPTDIAIAPDGSVYVVDFGNNRIQRFKLIREEL